MTKNKYDFTIIGLDANPKGYRFYLSADFGNPKDYKAGFSEKQGRLDLRELEVLPVFASTVLKPEIGRAIVKNIMHDEFEHKPGKLDFNPRNSANKGEAFKQLESGSGIDTFGMSRLKKKLEDGVSGYSATVVDNEYGQKVVDWSTVDYSVIPETTHERFEKAHISLADSKISEFIGKRESDSFEKYSKSDDFKKLPDSAKVLYSGIINPKGGALVNPQMKFVSVPSIRDLMTGKSSTGQPYPSYTIPDLSPNVNGEIHTSNKHSDLALSATMHYPEAEKWFVLALGESSDDPAVKNGLDVLKNVKAKDVSNLSRRYAYDNAISGTYLDMLHDVGTSGSYPKGGDDYQTWHDVAVKRTESRPVTPFVTSVPTFVSKSKGNFSSLRLAWNNEANAKLGMSSMTVSEFNANHDFNKDNAVIKFSDLHKKTLAVSIKKRHDRRTQNLRYEAGLKNNAEANDSLEP